MKTGKQKNGKDSKRQQTEPNRTRQQKGDDGKATSRKKASGGITPVRVKTERTNNPPAKRQAESSDRRNDIETRRKNS